MNVFHSLHECTSCLAYAGLITAALITAALIPFQVAVWITLLACLLSYGSLLASFLCL